MFESIKSKLEVKGIPYEVISFIDEAVSAQPTSASLLFPNQTSGDYVCDCQKTCSQMSSCAEAQYQLNVCGCRVRDGDNDGVACDTDCQ